MSTWTEERVSELRKLAGQGKSAGVIGKAMGLTRNQIVGKCHRTGIHLTGRGERLPGGGGGRRTRLSEDYIADLIARAEEHADAGYNGNQAAALLDVTRGHLRGVCERHAPAIWDRLSDNGADLTKRRPRTCKSCEALKQQVAVLEAALAANQRRAA